MLNVVGYTPKDALRVVDFIRKVQPAAAPDKGVLSRSVLIKDDKEIVGMVSYESHGDMGVVRYFLYDARIAGTDIVVGMFFALYQKAYTCGVKQLIAKVPSQEVERLFEMLGFKRVTGNRPDLTDFVREDVAIMLIHLKGTGV